MLDQVDQLWKVERLWQNRGDAHLQHGLRIDVQMRGENNDGNASEVAGFPEALEEVPAVDLGHRQIEQDHVRIVNLQRALALFAVAGEKDLKTMLSQRGGEHPAQRHVVIDDQHALPIDIADALAAGRVLRVDFVHDRSIVTTDETACRRLARIRRDRNPPSWSTETAGCAPWR